MTLPDERFCEVFGTRPVEPAEPAAADGFIWTVLPRHGRRPAAFLGRELLRADNSEAVRAGLRDAWSDIRIYELMGEGFMTCVRHLRAADGLPRWQDAWRTQDASGVLSALAAHDPDAPGEAVHRSAWQDLLHAVFGVGAAA